MSGLDQIVENILADAKSSADTIIKEADNYCEQYMIDVKEDTAKKIKEITKASAKERELYEEKIASGKEFRRRNAILKAKGEVIEDAINKAKDKLVNLPKNEYFDVLLDILKDNTWNEDGIMLLSSSDYSDMQSDFSDKAMAIAKEKGGSLKVEDGADKVKDGFILVYGEIEENCTFDAMFEAKKEEMRDAANKAFFLSDK